MTKPSTLNGRLAKWAFFLSQYEMQFLLKKAIKRQALLDFLAENQAPRVARLYEDLSYEVSEALVIQVAPDNQVWQHFFDGASRTGPNGQIMVVLGAVLVSP